MRTYNLALDETMNLTEVDKSKAYQEFDNGKNVYIKLSKNMWFMFNNEFDSVLTNFEDGIKHYISQEYDDDKLIITRHKNIAQYFRSKGINAKCVEYARPDDVYGKILYGGTIPLHLMSFAKECYILRTEPIYNADFDNIPADQLENFGLEIKKYVVTSEKVEM